MYRDAGVHTALCEDVQGLLDEERSVEDDESVAERQHIVAGSHLEKGSDCTLHDEEASQRWCSTIPQKCVAFVDSAFLQGTSLALTRPSSCSRSMGNIGRSRAGTADRLTGREGRRRSLGAMKGRCED